MTTFKDHKVSVNELLGFIPEALLSHLMILNLLLKKLLTIIEEDGILKSF
jgi:hypothetical protein